MKKTKKPIILSFLIPAFSFANQKGFVESFHCGIDHNRIITASSYVDPSKEFNDAIITVYKREHDGKHYTSGLVKIFAYKEKVGDEIYMNFLLVHPNELGEFVRVRGDNYKAPKQAYQKLHCKSLGAK